MPTNIDGFSVFGAIEQKWLSIGGPNSPLKHPVSNEFKTFDGVGRRQNFQGGMISWRPNTGAYIVWGLIGARWLQIGAEQFGYPITDETTTPDRRGRFNHFRAFGPNNSLIGESSIYWLPETGAHEIYGGIRDFWAKNGWERSKVGYPTGAEHNRSGKPGREQQFQRGRISWTPTSGASFAQPSISLRAVADQGRFIIVDGNDFTPTQAVKVGYDIFAGGAPTTHQTSEDTFTSDEAGSFHHPIRVNLAGDISGAQARATDVTTGVTADGSI